MEICRYAREEIIRGRKAVQGVAAGSVVPRTSMMIALLLLPYVLLTVPKASPIAECPALWGVDRLQACLRLRGGISRNLKFTVTSMPRAKSMKQVSARPWPSPPTLSPVRAAVIPMHCRHMRFVGVSVMIWGNGMRTGSANVGKRVRRQNTRPERHQILSLRVLCQQKGHSAGCDRETKSSAS